MKFLKNKEYIVTAKNTREGGADFKFFVNFPSSEKELKERAEDFVSAFVNSCEFHGVRTDKFNLEYKVWG